MGEKLKVTRERKFSAHHILIGAARAAFEDAEKREPGWFYSELTVITMCALALEAICNAFGERIRSDWKKFESLNPIAKIILISEKLGVSVDYDKEPWATAKWLYGFRNKIAHAKPEIVNESYVCSRDEYEKMKKKEPKSKIDKLINLDNAKRSLKCVEDIKNLFFEKIDIDDKGGLYNDSWYGTASILNDG